MSLQCRVGGETGRYRHHAHGYDAEGGSQRWSPRHACEEQRTWRGWSASSAMGLDRSSKTAGRSSVTAQGALPADQSQLQHRFDGRAGTGPGALPAPSGYVCPCPPRRGGEGRGWSLRSSIAIDARPSSLRPQTASSVQLVLSALEKEVLSRLTTEQQLTRGLGSGGQRR